MPMAKKQVGQSKLRYWRDVWRSVSQIAAKILFCTQPKLPWQQDKWDYPNSTTTTFQPSLFMCMVLEEKKVTCFLQHILTEYAHIVWGQMGLSYKSTSLLLCSMQKAFPLTYFLAKPDLVYDCAFPHLPVHLGGRWCTEDVRCPQPPYFPQF